MNDGLPGNAINGIMQDSLGFIWLATSRGLCKFDGHHFTTYTHSSQSQNSLSNNIARRLWFDKNGKMWVGLANGVDLFNLKTEKFSRLWLDSAKQRTGIGIYVNRFLERRDGKLLIATNNGIYEADPRTLAAEKFAKIPTTVVTNIAETRDASIWALSADSGVFHFNSRTGETVRYVDEYN